MRIAGLWLRSTSQYHARAIIWCGRHDGGERFWAAGEHAQEYSASVGADAARYHAAWFLAFRCRLVHRPAIHRREVGVKKTRC